MISEDNTPISACKASGEREGGGGREEDQGMGWRFIVIVGPWASLWADLNLSSPYVGLRGFV